LVLIWPFFFHLHVEHICNHHIIRICTTICCWYQYLIVTSPFLNLEDTFLGHPLILWHVKCYRY
jgi:hypothetical protein